MSDKTSLILGLRTTIYMVSDIVEGIAWYTKAFNTKPYFNEPFYVGFNIGGYELGLQSEEKDINLKTENVCSYWGVNDINETYQHLINLGATKHEEPHNVGGKLMVASVYDPWKNIIGIIYNPYFKL
jgi:lactoylglutathione lyase